MDVARHPVVHLAGDRSQRGMHTRQLLSTLMFDEAGQGLTRRYCNDPVLFEWPMIVSAVPCRYACEVRNLVEFSYNNSSDVKWNLPV
jgi:hypothetical protein